MSNPQTDTPSIVWRDTSKKSPLKKDIEAECDVSEILAQLLVNRDITDIDEVKKFIAPRLSELEDPATMQDIDIAAERIRDAVRAKEPILIFGDYDVDGVTSSALLYKLLKTSDAVVEVYLPKRSVEGYGLTMHAVEEIISRAPKLVITVDCGITATAEAAALREADIELIITDHHPPHNEVPKALAVLNPRRPTCNYKFKDLAGVGVAFKLAWEVARRFTSSKRVSPEMREFLQDALALVALGTVADVAPLTGENRTLVKYGLAALEDGRNLGITALKEVAQIKSGAISARDIGFRLGPRINAAGRMGSAEDALALMLEDDPVRAAELAKQLDAANTERRRVEAKILKTAQAEAEQLVASGAAGLVLAGADWHSGVVGIVAARVADKTGCPAAIGSTLDGIIKGSARSGGGSGVDVARALHECEELLISCGGHKAAAGFKLKEENLDAFRVAFDKAVKSQDIQESQGRILDFECELKEKDVNLALAMEVEKLEPYGQANPNPLFVLRNVELKGERKRLPSSNGLSFGINISGRRIRAASFSLGDRRRELEECSWSKIDIAFEFSRTQWSGPAGFELSVKDFRAV